MVHLKYIQNYIYLNMDVISITWNALYRTMLKILKNYTFYLSYCVFFNFYFYICDEFNTVIIMKHNSDSNQGYIVYHYEVMNDGRYVLIFEPNIFKDLNSVKVHISCLSYLSGSQFYYCRENEINRLDVILDDCEVINSDVCRTI